METSLVLVGHSIGCYIILEMMRRNPELKIIKAIMLFPTIERMAQTPQGKIMTPVLCEMRYLAYLSVFLLSLLPAVLKASLIKLLLGGICSLDQTVVQPTTDVVLFPCVANAMYLGGQEMRKVLERDNITIRKNLKKLIFYYGGTDNWCPVQYYHDIKQDFPHGDVRLCKKGFRHAFVLDAGSEVAKMALRHLCGDQLPNWPHYFPPSLPPPNLQKARPIWSRGHVGLPGEDNWRREWRTTQLSKHNRSMLQIPECGFCTQQLGLTVKVHQQFTSASRLL
uniref:Lipid droplet-associated hydrolase n=1 Tax=Mola mola TaxID=94237 RepID=A0A3Q3WZN5_MOLML